MGHAAKIVLASSSRYRRQMLARLGLPFEVCTPDVDEEAEGRAVADPYARTSYLADLKASNAASLHGTATVIGGDQLVVAGNEVFGKPLTPESAARQLSALSARSHEVVTALSVWHEGTLHRHTDVTRLRMRSLSQDEILRYIELDAPLDCAGSYRIETLGIALFEEYETHDPTALSGIPLIALGRILRRLGHPIP